MFFSADDDEQDFMSTGSSKLANIFGMDRASGQGGNESLTYTAPKQPKKKEPTPEGGAPAVLVASVVTAYKYVDNNHTSQGKLGCALLGNRAAKDYRILLYVNKQQQTTNAKITPSFAFNIQQNNYATFYDDARQTWSIMFDSTENAVKFSKEMALAKANTSPGAPTELIQQDLVQGEGGVLEAGDSVEVKYTGWLFSSGTLGKVFDQSQGENYFRFKVGKGKVIKGWDQGMLGMKKGGKRMFVIPPHLAYGSQGVADRIPPDSTLAFEVEVVRVKLQKGESPAEPAPPPSVPSPGPEPDDPDDHSVKGRTKSINEQLTHSASGGKSKLISRMAKMGQPMLPFQGAVPAQPEDSDEDGGEQARQQPPSPKPPLPSKPRSGSSLSSGPVPTHTAVPAAVAAPAQPVGVAAAPTFTSAQPGVVMVNGSPMVLDPVTGLLQPQPQPQPAFLQNLPGAQQVAVYQNPNLIAQQQQQQQQAALIQQQLQQQQQQQQQQMLQQQLLNQGLGGLPNQTTGLGGDALTPALLTESRQQNTEVRITLSKVSDKVDRILDKLENTGMQAMMGGAVAPYGSNMPAPTMEANVLMHNITRIVQENERLKKDVYEQSNKVQELNEKMSSLIEKNQRYVEQSHTALEQRNEGYKYSASQSQARVLALEQEKVHLATELSSASSQISTLQLELAELRRQEAEHRQKLQEMSTTSSSTKEEVAKLTTQREEDEQKIQSLTDSVREHKQVRKSLEAKLATYTEELADLKSTSETLERSLSERKRKAAEDRRKLEEDMEDAKISYEQTIEGLRERLRKQQKSVNAETESKMSQVEEEISKEWQAKCDKMVAAAAAKHERQMVEAQEEKKDLQLKIEQLEKKLETVRSSGSSTEQQVSQLQDELSDMRVWKEKYEKLRAQATSMKDKYEERIQTLEQENDKSMEEANSTAQQQTQRLRDHTMELQQQIQTLRQQLQQAQADAKVEINRSQQQSQATGGSSADVATEVKKIMNSVFQTLRAEFVADESYIGSEILGIILNVIKQTTLKLVNKVAENQEDEDEDEDEEDEDEEDEEEEEEDKEEEEEDEEEVNVDEETEEEESQSKAAAAAKHEETVGEDEEEEEKEEKAQSGQPDAEEVVEQPQEESQPSVSTGIGKESEAEASLKAELSDTHSSKIEEKAENKEEVSPVDGRSSEGTGSGSDFEIVSESGIDQELAGEAADSTPELPKEEKSELVAGKNEEEESASSGDATPVKEVDQELQQKAKIPEAEEALVAEEEKPGEEKAISNPLNAPESDEAESNIVKKSEKPENKPPAQPSPPSAEQKEKNSTPITTKPRQGSVTVDADSREPPPFFDDDDEDDDKDSPLFGKDDLVSETFGVDFTAKPRTASKASLTQPAKKVDLMTDEDSKPQPPPPLFGDDSDDDDLDWLS
ncbi:peptidylprolyl isomerase [Plakobranchus ocellatus]|uniref:peptidylprolyl isomerase n=1 Tax=Plakobranchus ocellatus TaxID=259542 RepID=A0AAV3Y0V6_9GAST|nr:peptidylprolyl isomerase [Plakobranchus ocellatus]